MLDFMPDQRRRRWARLAELDQHWVNVVCLLVVLTGHICVLHITECEDIKTVAQLIEPADDLVTVDHFPGSKPPPPPSPPQRGLRSSEPCGGRCCRYKSWVPPHLYLSTVQRSYLVTLITKAIDTTSISHKTLWLRCWRGDISIFFYKKTRLF